MLVAGQTQSNQPILVRASVEVKMKDSRETLALSSASGKITGATLTGARACKVLGFNRTAVALDAIGCIAFGVTILTYLKGFKQRNGEQEDKIRELTRERNQTQTDLKQASGGRAQVTKELDELKVKVAALQTELLQAHTGGRAPSLDVLQRPAAAAPYVEEV